MHIYIYIYHIYIYRYIYHIYITYICKYIYIYTHIHTGQIKVRALVKLIRKAPNPEKGLNPHNL